MGRLKVLTGMRFGRLLVGGIESDRGVAQLKWMCLCDCGSYVAVAGQSLRSGLTQSCGCLRAEKAAAAKQKPKGESGFRILYSGYKSHSKDRGIEFRLSEAEFRDLTQKNCHWCGSEPQQISRVKRSRSNPKTQKNSEFLHNGIDRVDSQGSYVAGNVVPCCKICNWMKNALTPEQFLAHVEKISTHQRRN